MNNTTIKTRNKKDILTIFDLGLAFKVAECMVDGNLKGCWGYSSGDIAYAYWDGYFNPKVFVGKKGRFKEHPFTDCMSRLGTHFIDEG